MESDLIIKFEGDLHQIDANTLINSLACIVTIVEETNHEYFNDQMIDIKVKALTRGSFIIDIDLLSKTYLEIAPLLNQENISYLEKIIAIVLGLLGIRKFLRGKKPGEIIDSNDKIILKNNEGYEFQTEKIIYNIYNSNININEAINNNFEALHTDESIKSFQVSSSKSNSIFKADKEEFSKLTNQEKLEEILPTDKVIKIRTYINLFKVVFDNKYKWEFVYRGNKIRAQVIDDNFFKKIDKGEKFSKGDSLEVELEIHQVYDDTIKTYLNKRYTVLKVFGHIPRDQQIDFEF